MTLNEITEEELKKAKFPWPETIEQLNEQIIALLDREHTYYSKIYAMGIAANQTKNFVAMKLSVTGYQVSAADLDMMSRSRNLDNPFAVLNAKDMLYPQYNIENKVKEYLEKWQAWAKEEAKKLLEENKDVDCSPEVWDHWQKLANQP